MKVFQFRRNLLLVSCAHPAHRCVKQANVLTLRNVTNSARQLQTGFSRTSSVHFKGGKAGAGSVWKHRQSQRNDTERNAGRFCAVTSFNKTLCVPETFALIYLVIFICEIMFVRLLLNYISEMTASSQLYPLTDCHISACTGLFVGSVAVY